MPQPLIVVTTLRVKGEIDQIEKYAKRIVDIVRENEPQVIAFNIFLNEDATEMKSIQVHPNTESMDFHMRVLRDNWDESFAEYSQMLEPIGIEYSGTPPDTALEMDRESGIPLRVNPRHLVGFTRGTASN